MKTSVIPRDNWARCGFASFYGIKFMPRDLPLDLINHPVKGGEGAAVLARHGHASCHGQLLVHLRELSHLLVVAASGSADECFSIPSYS